MNRLKHYVFIVLLLALSAQSYAQDWANLNRFKSVNSELQDPAEGEHRIVFMGNSITEGWPKYSSEYFKNKPYINRGISGQTTPQMLLRFRQDVIDLKPSAVVILAGINDIAQNTGPIRIEAIVDNINSMIELSLANNIKVILCSVLPANNFPWRPEIKPAEKVIQLNNHLKKMAVKHHLTYVDYYTAMVDNKKGLKDNLGYDGVHPNKAGYAIMEALLNKAIGKTLKNIPPYNLPDPLQAGWNGKKVCKVLKEDDTQRILKCTFPPNIGHEKHYHRPHFGYALQGGTFRITDAKGTKTITVKDGTTWSKDELSMHKVKNVGNTTSVYLIIESKH